MAVNVAIDIYDQGRNAGLNREEIADLLEGFREESIQRRGDNSLRMIVRVAAETNAVIDFLRSPVSLPFPTIHPPESATTSQYFEAMGQVISARLGAR